MKKVLLITDVNFWFLGAGHRNRISSLVIYLSSVVDLTIIFIGTINDEDLVKINRINGVRFVALERFKTLTSSGYGRKLKTFLKSNKFDSVIIEYIHISYFLEYLTSEVQLILDAHDITCDRSASFKEYNYEGRIFGLAEHNEKKIMSFFHYVLLLCTPDVTRFNAFNIPAQPLLVPHPAGIQKNVIRKKVSNIVYVASNYLPNADGIKYFIENCWPAINAAHPPIQLLIFGSVYRQIGPNAAPNVRILGYVDNLKTIYEQADIIINPVRFGAGMKIKNIEALANGIPLVTTSHGARGLEIAAGSSFLIADQPVETINALNLLIADYGLRLNLSKNAHKFIKNKFNADRCFAPLLNVIKKVEDYH